ncbi:MAG: hypothetical protein JWM80_4268 [Cyanobacteria bacterium RYN_339]|nr:hypothetical protein [Cyanobacteria bacterium RYN_339]
MAALHGASPRPSAAAGAPEQPVSVPIAAASVAPTPVGVASAAGPGGPQPAVATLKGKVVAPATLLTENGAGIIANNAAARRLLAVDQAPVAGATVTVVDAAGKPLAGLSTKTDAQGAYMFTAPLPADCLVVKVDLGAKGSLQAIAPAGAHQADADLISTLTTGYILDRYVATQPDKTATLDKLPGDVEAQTRAKALAAYNQGSVPVPDALTPDRVTVTVDALRRRDGDFDLQMEAVKRLLIAAGLSDLGNGELATKVSLVGISAPVVAPDGSLYMYEARNGRIWRIGADGRMVAMAGSASGDGKASVDGQPGLKAAFGEVVGLALDEQGRALILDEPTPYPNQDFRVTRLGADGTLAELVPPGTWKGGFIQAIADGGNGRVLLGCQHGKLWAVELGKAPVLLHDFQDDFRQLGRDADGNLYAIQSEAGVVQRIDPVTFAKTPVTLPDQGGNPRLDGHGNVYVTEQPDHLTLVPAKGATRRVLDGFTSPGYSLQIAPYGAALAPDGTTLLSQANQLVRIRDGKREPVAGLTGTGGGVATGLSLAWPNGAACAPDGTLYVSDSPTIYRIKDGQGSVFVTLPKNRSGVAPDIYGVQVDAAGHVYTRTSQGVVLVGADGKTTAKDATLPGGADFAIAPDGTCYTSTNSSGGTAYHMVAGKPEELDEDPAWHTHRVAVAPDGVVYLGSSDGSLLSWTAKDGAKLLTTDPAFAIPSNFWGFNFLAVDAKGRIYASLRNAINQYDPATHTIKKVAGPGATHFSGTGVDDSLDGACGLCFSPAGDLYFADQEHKQIKRIPAAEL